MSPWVHGVKRRAIPNTVALPPPRRLRPFCLCSALVLIWSGQSWLCPRGPVWSPSRAAERTSTSGAGPERVLSEPWLDPSARVSLYWALWPLSPDGLRASLGSCEREKAFLSARPLEKTGPARYSRFVVGCSQVVRQRFLVPPSVGSNPTTPVFEFEGSVRAFRLLTQKWGWAL